MDRRTAIDRIRRHADDIRGFGVARLYLFGSTGRDRATEHSDVDLFIDLRRGAKFSLFDLMDLRAYLQRILGVRADVIPRGGLHSAIRRDVERQAVRVL